MPGGDKQLVAGYSVRARGSRCLESTALLQEPEACPKHSSCVVAGPANSAGAASAGSHSGKIQNHGARAVHGCLEQRYQDVVTGTPKSNLQFVARPQGGFKDLPKAQAAGDFNGEGKLDLLLPGTRCRLASTRFHGNFA